MFNFWLRVNFEVTMSTRQFGMGLLSRSVELGNFMETEKVKALIEAGLPGAQVEVTGDGRHFEVMVVSEAFQGKSLLQRHRMVLATVGSEIASEELHALSIRASTQ